MEKRWKQGPCSLVGSLPPRLLLRRLRLLAAAATAVQRSSRLPPDGSLRFLAGGSPCDPPAFYSPGKPLDGGAVIGSPALVRRAGGRRSGMSDESRIGAPAVLENAGIARLDPAQPAPGALHRQAAKDRRDGRGRPCVPVTTTSPRGAACDFSDSSFCDSCAWASAWASTCAANTARKKQHLLASVPDLALSMNALAVRTVVVGSRCSKTPQRQNRKLMLLHGPRANNLLSQSALGRLSTESVFGTPCSHHLIFASAFHLIDQGPRCNTKVLLTQPVQPTPGASARADRMVPVDPLVSTDTIVQETPEQPLG